MIVSLLDFKEEFLTLGFDAQMQNNKKLGRFIYIFEGEFVKIFRPRLVRRSGAILIQGDIGFWPVSKSSIVFENESTFFDCVTLCPIFNFPKMLKSSEINDGTVKVQFVEAICHLVLCIPSYASEFNELFDNRFFDKNAVDRCVLMVAFLRKSIDGNWLGNYDSQVNFRP